MHTESNLSVSEVPLVHPADADVDLEVLKSIPKDFFIDSEEKANWLIRKIGDARKYAEHVKDWADRELRRAAREEQTLMFLFGRQIEMWTKDEIAKLKGRRKSLNLPAGCVGFRSSPTRLVVDDEASVLIPTFTLSTCSAHQDAGCSSYLVSAPQGLQRPLESGRAWSTIMASLRQAAKQLGVHYTTLRRWIHTGTGPRALIKRNRKRSTYRITAKDLDEFVRRNSRG